MKTISEEGTVRAQRTRHMRLAYNIYRALISVPAQKIPGTVLKIPNIRAEE